VAPHPQRDDSSSRVEPAASSSRDRARRRLSGARDRYERSWVQDVVGQLTAQHFFDWTTIFGAELLWSALPFVILLSSVANERIDDDLSRHIGLNSQGARIVRGLFRTTPAHAVEPIVTGLLFALVGIIMVVRSLQVLYERAFDQEHRGWRDLPRLLAWVAVLLGALIVQAIVHGPVRSTFGPVIEVLVRILAETIFFAWTMHFLLAGHASWRVLIRPALVTAILWLGLSLFSSLYFSSVIIDDSRLYGTIGVVFTLLTWFMLIGAVIMLGAAVGAVWQQRRGGAF
jgi:membrane protein